MNRISVLTWIMILILPLHSSVAQHRDSLETQSSRKLKVIVIGGGLTYTGALVGLNQLWYSQNERTSFHFFNDNSEWKQVDKLGHLYSSFYISEGFSRVLQSASVPERRANLVAAVTAFGVLLPIEVFDGYSKAYGASVGDMVANAGGAGLFLIQEHFWSEVRIRPKFSFHTTQYSAKRPNVLGSEFQEKILKDYNGQTYWLSFDMDRFTRFPKWLNVAVGYGAEGMVFARDHENITAGYRQPYRQYYLSIDWDPTAIKSKSKVIRTLLYVAGMIKLPAPAVAFSSRGIKFHPLYF